MLGTLKNKLARRPGLSRPLFLLVVIVVLAIVVSTTYVSWSKNGEPESSEFIYNETGETPPPGGYLEINSYIIGLNPTQNQYQVRFEFLARGALASPNPDGSRDDSSPAVNFTVQIDTMRKTFKAGEAMQAIDMPLYFWSGDVNRYPFDEYNGNIYIIAAYNTTELVPFVLRFTSTMTSFDSTSNYTANLPGFSNFLSLNFSRSAVTLGFSIFVMIIMWCISLAVISISFDVWMRNRNAEPPVLATCMAAIFSLPALRGTQPNIPPVGCAADLLSFFWCMALVVCTAIAMILMYIVRWKAPAPAAPPAAAPSQQRLTPVASEMDNRKSTDGALMDTPPGLGGSRSVC